MKNEKFAANHGCQPVTWPRGAQARKRAPIACWFAPTMLTLDAENFPLVIDMQAATHCQAADAAKASPRTGFGASR
jgi:hypothetical protein